MRGRSTVVLRRGGLADVAATGRVMRAAFDAAFGEAWTDSQLSAQLVGPATTLTLAMLDGELAGFSLVRMVMDEAELLLLATVPALRGRGVGAALLAAVVADARAADAAALFLEVRRGNAAEGLYTAQGFTCVGERPRYYRGANGLVSDARTFRLELASR